MTPPGARRSDLLAQRDARQPGRADTRRRRLAGAARAGAAAGRGNARSGQGPGSRGSAQGRAVGRLRPRMPWLLLHYDDYS